MLRGGFKAAAFNITGFILILGSIYFIDLEGIKETFGYIFLGVGLIHMLYITYTYYLYQKIKIPPYYLLHIGAICMLIMAYFRMSLVDWETPTLLIVLSLFVFLCARQLQGRIKVFPKGKQKKKTE